MRSTILVTGLGLAVLIGTGVRAPELMAYEATTVTDGGTLTGTVKFQGTAPAPEPQAAVQPAAVVAAAPQATQ